MYLDKLADNAPALLGAFLCLLAVWRITRRVFSHVETVQAATLAHSQVYADKLSAVVDRNTEVVGRCLATLDRHDAGRWAVSARNTGKGRGDVTDELWNPKNEPVYGVPPGELDPETTVREDMLQQRRDWGHAALGLAELHAAGVRGANVLVAVLDTGVEETHPGLAGKVASGANHTTSRDRLDRQGHGTHCAGVVAELDDATGLCGVAPDARLHNGKVLGDNGSGLSSWIAAGIRDAARAGADVISLSLGGPTPDADTRAAVAEAAAAGVWIAAAAGNDGPGTAPSYPGDYPDVVCVAAVGPDGAVARFSSRHPEVDVAAPGVSVMSCYVGGRYAALSGTSMATPYVAGVLALARGELKRRGLAPPPMPAVLQALAETAKDLTPAGRDPASGYGLIRPKAFIERILSVAGGGSPPTPPAPPPAAPAEPIVLTDPRLAAAGVASVAVALAPRPATPAAPIALPPGLRVALRLLLPALRRLAERTQTPLDDLVLKVFEVLLGLQGSAAAAGEDWWPIATAIVKALVPALREIAKRTGTTVDDLVLDLVEKLLSQTKSAQGLSARELAARARERAAAAGLTA